MTSGDIFMMLWQKIPFESYENSVLSDSQLLLGELEIALRTMFDPTLKWTHRKTTWWVRIGEQSILIFKQNKLAALLKKHYFISSPSRACSAPLKIKSKQPHGPDTEWDFGCSLTSLLLRAEACGKLASSFTSTAWGHRTKHTAFKIKTDF